MWWWWWWCYRCAYRIHKKDTYTLLNTKNYLSHTQTHIHTHHLYTYGTHTHTHTHTHTPLLLFWWGSSTGHILFRCSHLSFMLVCVVCVCSTTHSSSREGKQTHTHTRTEQTCPATSGYFSNGLVGQLWLVRSIKCHVSAKNAHHRDWKLSSNCLFCLMNSPRLQNIHLSVI